MWLLAGGVAFLTAVFAQRPWREYPAFEHNDFPIPHDYREKAAWALARLMYPNAASPAMAGITDAAALAVTGL